MKLFGFRRYAIGAGACTALAACMALPMQPAAPSSGSWMTPDVKSIALLYVADRLANKVYVYSYPKIELKGALAGFGQVAGLCVDRLEDVWVVDSGASALLEYAHGRTKPIATLQDARHEIPWACSVSQRTGDLAVANINRGESRSGSVSIYAGAQGAPKVYSDQAMSQMISLSYDDRQNLFVAGIPYARPRFAFAELRRGRRKFVGISLVGAPIKRPGGVQFGDGKLAVGDDQGRSTVYQVSGGTITGSTSLMGACHVVAFFINGSSLIATSRCKRGMPSLMFYAYPLGGHVTKQLTGLRDPVGVAISSF